MRHGRSDLVRHVEDVAQVGAAVLVGRRPHGAEHGLGLVETRRQFGSEVQTALADVARDHFLKAGLIDGDDALLQLVDFFLVDVDTGHFDAHLGKAGTGDETYVSRSDDRYFHGE